jgi:FixJ family two-component response regulator
VSFESTKRKADLPRNTMISIIDDDMSVLEATKGLVRSLGYEVATFASAEEFLRSDRMLNTSCLISDMKMPGLNGLELQSHLIGERHQIPIIFVTACSEERVRTRAMDAGAFGFFGKPFDEKGFVGCLGRAWNEGC